MGKKEGYKNLLGLMRTYDKHLKTEKNQVFLRTFKNRGRELCMPLDEEETYILRSLTGINAYKDSEVLAKELDYSKEEIKEKLARMKSVLRIYFYSVNSEDKPIDESNTETTIFDLGLDDETIYTLRLIRCYYLRDLKAKNVQELEELKGLICLKDYRTIINYIVFYSDKTLSLE